MGLFFRTLRGCFLVVSLLPVVVLSLEDGGGDRNSSSSKNETGQETAPRNDSLVIPTPVDVSQFNCSAEAQCTLEIGETFGNPWIKTKAKDVNYFQVQFPSSQDAGVCYSIIGAQLHNSSTVVLQQYRTAYRFTRLISTPAWEHQCQFSHLSAGVWTFLEGGE